MSNLFLIGNGFDLSCGLKTSYKDVYVGYIEAKSDKTLIQNFKKMIDPSDLTWADFEAAMAKNASKFGNEDDFIECIRDFKRYLSAYLFEQQEAFLDIFRNVPIVEREFAKEMKRSKDDFYKGCSHNCTKAAERNIMDWGNTCKYISFNYTEVFDKLIELVQPKNTKNIFDEVEGKFIHIHGTLREADMVLGADSKDQIDAGFEIGVKTERAFIKPQFNKAFDVERAEKAMSWINSASNICTYGLSLGDTDLTWRNALLEALRNDGRKQLFIFSYDLSSKKGLSAEEKMELEEDKKEYYMEKWNAEEYRDVFDRIHIPCCYNIFDLEHVYEDLMTMLDKK